MKERLTRHESMRGWFAYELHRQMENNGNIWVVTADLGFGMFDAIQRDYPERFVNVGAAEQVAVGVAVGMAVEGKIPIVYSITPFLLYRPFETVRSYLHSEQIPVVLVGGGRDGDYQHDGFSHWAEEDQEVMRVLSGVESHWPETKEEIPELLEKVLTNPRPTYINLKR